MFRSHEIVLVVETPVVEMTVATGKLSVDVSVEEDGTHVLFLTAVVFLDPFFDIGSDHHPLVFIIRICS